MAAAAVAARRCASVDAETAALAGRAADHHAQAKALALDASVDRQRAADLQACCRSKRARVELVYDALTRSASHSNATRRHCGWTLRAPSSEEAVAGAQFCLAWHLPCRLVATVAVSSFGQSLPAQPASIGTFKVLSSGVATTNCVFVRSRVRSLDLLQRVAKATSVQQLFAALREAGTQLGRLGALYDDIRCIREQMGAVVYLATSPDARVKVVWSTMAPIPRRAVLTVTFKGIAVPVVKFDYFGVQKTSGNDRARGIAEVVASARSDFHSDSHFLRRPCAAVKA